ncbi:DUF3488 domain-containing protein [Lusitaniella coriacea LEGE 07157]|uniref:DUF3488 domain-containing protein n=1 Tax=Lusitaniella coriacea LEGE 07157 TaxID=945747 RepID=A0A8J7DVK9_9CYAN|nr:DUF3488 and DUF4129 domain-containing transglutaminase family protein [Lusitaniella coriacea]MBE9115827.1 DUF3488 domain-containing protein [Lusitaniella coriacea LEGE 07157]
METLNPRHLPLLKQLWQRLESIPAPKTEESLLLRVLVQVLVIVGIIATDVAAETQMSLWAIPLGIVGATWSWYRRRRRNITAKFAIAIGMLLAMAAFFGNLLANLNDTRLVLAELLIQLQILHSFDLPRRKDLGYSMVIGLILLGVAATLSETLAFAPILLLFLAIALPVLVLDYRSRLGFVDGIFEARSRNTKSLKQKAKANYSPLSLKRLSLFLAVILALGLTIFALMPRFPGYQQFTFPVTGAAELENTTFNAQNRGIFNPGVRSGAEGEDAGNNGEDGEREGEGGEGLYYGFQSQIDQTTSGGADKPLKPKVVLRVRSQAPGFWRVLAFDRYTGKGWDISRDEQLITVERPSWSYRFFLSSAYGRGKTQEVVQTYTVVNSLPNLLPALTHPRWLYFPTPEVALDAEGSIRSPASLREGLTYTVISDVPQRDRAQLRAATAKYSEPIRQYYLQLPPEVKKKVSAVAEELLARSPKPITSPYEKALYLAQAIKQNYSRTTQFPTLKRNEDLVEAFLFRNEGGYPDQFATVLTVMLRSIGIPARLAVGFNTGEFNPFTGFYLVRNTDAHALTEVFFPDYGWFTFDPLPGHELIPQSFEEPQTFVVLRQFWNWVAGWLPPPVAGFFSYLWQKSAGAIALLIGWLWRLVSNGVVGALIGLVLTISASFLLWLVWSNWKTWRDRARLAKLPPPERLYRQMLNTLAARGYRKHPAQTPLEYARAAQEQHPSTAPTIEEIAKAYVGWRYGNQNPNISDLQQQLRALTRNLRQLKP